MMTSGEIITRTLLRSHLDVALRWIRISHIDSARRSIQRARIELWKMEQSPESESSEHKLLRERLDRIGRHLEAGEEDLRLAVDEIENALSEMESRRPSPADRKPARVTED